MSNNTNKTDPLKGSTQADAFSNVSETPRVAVSVNALVIASRISSVINKQYNKVEAGTGPVEKAWILVALFNELANVDVTYKGPQPKKRDIINWYLSGLTRHELHKYFALLQNYRFGLEQILRDSLSNEDDVELDDTYCLEHSLNLCRHFGQEAIVEESAVRWGNSRLYADQALTYRNAENDPFARFDKDFKSAVYLFDTILSLVEAHLESLAADGKDPGRVQVFNHERYER